MLELSERERRILVCIEHQGLEPVSGFRQQLGYNAHTIRYCLNNLKKKGVITGRAPFINPYPLGFSDFTLFFSLSAEKSSVRDRMLAAIIASPRVAWVAKIGGDFQFGVGILAKHVEEASETLKNLAAGYGNLFFAKSLIVKVSFTAFGRKYLSENAPEPTTLAFSRAGAEQEIDHTDHIILKAISKAGDLSHRSLSEQLGIPLTTLNRRLKRLEEVNLICGYIYRLSLGELGIQEYRLLIYARGISPELTEGLYLFAKKHPQVRHFVECLGEWDYELGAEVFQAENITDVRREIYEAFGQEIRNIKLVQIFRHLKFNNYPFE